jgi:hypothetical protein
MKNPDRDSDHARRRNTGDGDDQPDTSGTDGKEAARLLYGGFTDTDNNTDSTDGPSE